MVGGFAGHTTHLTTCTPEAMAFHEKLVKACPLRPEGWIRYLCYPEPWIVSQEFA